MSSVMSGIMAQMLTDAKVTADSGLTNAYNAPIDFVPGDFPYGLLDWGEAEIISEWDANLQIAYQRSFTIEVHALSQEENDLATQKLAYLWHKQPYRGQLAALGVSNVTSVADIVSSTVDNTDAEYISEIQFVVFYTVTIS